MTAAYKSKSDDPFTSTLLNGKPMSTIPPKIKVLNFKTIPLTMVIIPATRGKKNQGLRSIKGLKTEKRTRTRPITIYIRERKHSKCVRWLSFFCFL